MITKKKLEELHSVNIARYEALLRNSAESGLKINQKLVMGLIRIWNEVLGSEFDYSKLSETAKEEVIQALYGDAFPGRIDYP